MLNFRCLDPSNLKGYGIFLGQELSEGKTWDPVENEEKDVQNEDRENDPRKTDP